MGTEGPARGLIRGGGSSTRPPRRRHGACTPVGSTGRGEECPAGKGDGEVDHHGRGRLISGGRWLLALGLGALTALSLAASPASASTLKDCLAQQHVCVASDGRSLVSTGQEAQ